MAVDPHQQPLVDQFRDPGIGGKVAPGSAGGRLAGALRLLRPRRIHRCRDAARAEAEVMGAQLVDLATLDADLRHALAEN